MAEKPEERARAEIDRLLAAAGWSVQSMSYAKTLGVGAVFKRLGFLLARYAPEEQEAIKQCARSLTQGYTQLDPALPARKFVTAWRLSLPEGWKAR